MNHAARVLSPAVVACVPLLLADSIFAQPAGPEPARVAGEAVLPPFLKPAHDPSVQISEYIRCIYRDRDGRLWLGTNSDGVCRYDGASLTFLSVKDGLAGNAVRKIVQTADGAMWFTTEGGVSRYHDGRFRNYTTADGLSSDDTWSMMLDRAGTLWVGTREGVCRYVGAGNAGAGDTKKNAGADNGAGKPFVAFPIPRAAVETRASRFDPRLVWSFFEAADGAIWFGTDGEGVRRYDGQAFTSYTAKDGLGGDQVRCVFGDRQGRIWIGGDGAGVSCFEGGKFRNFTTNDGLGNDRVFVIFEDKAGDLWFSTLGQGVTRYDGTSFTAYRQLGDLPRTHVQSIHEDEDGTLWFGCSGGLFRFDGKTFINVTKNGPWR